MVRWIAFDDETAEAVVSRFKRGAAEIKDNDPLDAALSVRRPSLIVFPSITPGRVLMARLQPKTEGISPASEPISFEATGFLGLLDEPVFTRRPEPVPQKRKWWQRRIA